MRWVRWFGPPLVLLVLGGWLLSRQYGLWYDELYTAEVAPRPVTEIVSALVRGEGTIPYLRDAPPSYNGPYYVAAHLWLAATPLGADETGLRLLSLLASAGAMVLFSAAVTRLAGAAAGLAAGLVAASNPFVVQLAAEARGYGIALLATAAAALGLARWLDGRDPRSDRAARARDPRSDRAARARDPRSDRAARARDPRSDRAARARDPRSDRAARARDPRSDRALLLFGLGAAAAGLAHWFALLVITGLALAAVVLRGREAAPVLLVTALAALPTAGLVAIALVNGVGTSGAEWIGAVGLGAPRRLLEAWAGSSPLLLVLSGAAVVAAFLRRRWGRTERQTGAVVVGAAWVAVPVASVTAAGLVRPVFVARYLLPATLGLALLMALGLIRLPRVAAGVAVAALVLVSAGVTVGLVARGPTEDVRGAVRAVAAGHRPGQPVIAAARWDALGLDHYARREHPGLVLDVVLPGTAIPPSEVVWVVRRAREGLKGDTETLDALDVELGARGLRVAEEARFEGRASDVLVQRWAGAATPALTGPLGPATPALTGPLGPA